MLPVPCDSIKAPFQVFWLEITIGPLGPFPRARFIDSSRVVVQLASQEAKAGVRPRRAARRFLGSVDYRWINV